MPDTDNPYGVDTDMDLASALFRFVADGYDGEQITERHDVTLDQAERLIAAYVHRVLHADAPPAPSTYCLVNTFDGWCMRHGCYHPAQPEESQ